MKRSSGTRSIPENNMERLPKTYNEPGYRGLQQVYLSDASYADAIRSFVIVNTDCYILNRTERTFYLGKRKVYASKGWWGVGGRMKAGETEKEAIKNIFERETGLDILPEKFEFINMQRHFFAFRNQPPQEMGCDCLNYNFVLELTPEEIESVSLHPNEYESPKMRGFKREDLIAEKVPYSIVDLYELVFP